MKKNAEEVKSINSASSWYLNEQLDFDKDLIKFRYQTIKPMLVGASGLELGSAEGVMTNLLINDFESLTVVDASLNLLQAIPPNKKLIKFCSLFEDFAPKGLYDSIIIEHVLEHVENPNYLLQRAKEWLAPGGRLFIGVPNGNSIHRLAAVKMGLLNFPTELNERDKKLGHRRVYTPTTFHEELVLAGLKVVDFGGVFFKPISNAQIQADWTSEMIEGFYRLGKDFPEYAAEIYAVTEKNS